MIAVHIAEIMTVIVSCLPYAVTSGIQNFCWMTILRCNDIHIFGGGRGESNSANSSLRYCFKRQIPGVGLLNDSP